MTNVAISPTAMAKRASCSAQAAGHVRQDRLRRMIAGLPVAVMTVDPGNLLITDAVETSKALVRSLEHLLLSKADTPIGASVDGLHRHPDHQRRILRDRRTCRPTRASASRGPPSASMTVARPTLTWAAVTKEAKAERCIRHLAPIDTLTGPANRVTTEDDLRQRTVVPGTPSSPLHIDLDGANGSTTPAATFWAMRCRTTSPIARTDSAPMTGVPSAFLTATASPFNSACGSKTRCAALNSNDGLENA